MSKTPEDMKVRELGTAQVARLMNLSQSRIKQLCSEEKLVAIAQELRPHLRYRRQTKSPTKQPRGPMDRLTQTDHVLMHGVV